MARRLIALLAAVLTAGALLPAVAAFAQANATASIAAANRDILPGDRSFSVTVNNTESGNSVSGTRINAVFINVPAGPAGVTLQDSAGTAPSGWTGKVVKAGNLQTVEYRATESATGTGVAPGGSVTFTFPTTVVAPLSADRVGSFTVAVSSDGGNNVRNATAAAEGALTTKVRILEIIANSLKPVAPAGVTDLTATAEQKGIRYEFLLKNHARSQVQVTGRLESALETINGTAGGGTTMLDVAAGDTTPFPFTVDLGSASSQRTAVFTAKAAVGTVAEAVQRQASLTVQILPTLTLSNLRPDRTASTRDGISVRRTFTVTAVNAGPTLTLDGGTLEFAQVRGLDAGKLTVPVTLPTNQSVTLRFEDVLVLGAPGVYDADLAFTGADANDKPFDTLNTGRLANAITIDNLAPIFELVESILPIAHGDIRQHAAKPGDSIGVSVRVTSADRDIDTGTLKVVLEQSVGQPIPVSCPPSSSVVEGIQVVTCSGSVTTTGTNAFHPEATTFSAKATVLDTAGNPAGQTESVFKVIDRLIPALDNPGRTTSERTIKIQFSDDQAFPIYGGCDPSQYRIDGFPNAVEKVTFEFSTEQCALNGADALGSGVRILHLKEAMQPNATPSVRYVPGSRTLGSDPLFDGAAHLALEKLISTVIGVAPEAPQIRLVQRNTASGEARETAYFDADEPARFPGGPTGAYFTRFAGDDLVVRYAGVYDGYSIQVLDHNNAVLFRQDNLSQDRDVLGRPQPTEREIRIPLGDAAPDGTYLRKLRFLAASGDGVLPGDMTTFQVVVDRVLPGLAGAALVPNTATQVRASFSEKIVEGTNHTVDWVGNEVTPNEEDADARTYYFADAVEVVDMQTRLLTFPFPGEGPFGGADYFLRSTNGLRYRDRAGNALANTLE